MIKSKPYILFFFVFLLCVNVFGQNKDSLLQVANKANADTHSVKALNELTLMASNEADYDNALLYAEQAKHLSKKLNYNRGLFNSLNKTGIVYWLKGSYPDAQKYCLQALTVAEELNNKQFLYDVYYELGNVNYSTRNTEKALYYYNKSLEIGEQLDNKSNLVKAYLGIGDMYEADTAQSLCNYRKALVIAQEINDHRNMAIIYNNIGTIYQTSDANKALSYYTKSAELNQKIGDIYNVAVSCLNMAEIYGRQKKYAMANDFLNKSLTLGKQAGAKEILQEAYRIQYYLDSLKGDYVSVFKNYKIYKLYGDSIENVDAEKRMVQDQMQYEFDKKEAIAKEEQKKKDALTAADKQRNRIVLILGSCVLLIIAVFAVFMYNRFKITQRQKKIIEQKEQETQQQKKLVEEKQHEILDSINYAKRLQQAILPPQEFINKYLPDSFVLYKPKDIVAGDFYWAELFDDKFFIAAADSTGHGVPGAMVSVVCSNALNRAVKEFKLSDTGKIIDKTRELVIETFEKSESEVKDGMDVSLLCIDKKNKKVFWSGANNPLWYFENNEMIEITADKQPIGKTENPKPFNTHEIEYKENTNFYLFTDGLADQFGGPKGKKFKYKQFSELLQSLIKTDCKQQSTLIDKAFEEWKGDLEQVDDVCVIGIKI